MAPSQPTKEPLKLQDSPQDQQANTRDADKGLVGYRVTQVTNGVTIAHTTPNLTPQDASEVPQDTSDISPGTSEVAPGISDASPGVSDVSQGTSDVPPRTTKLQHETRGSSELSESFRVSKSAVNRGRPKVRNQQNQVQKKQRIAGGRKTANKLVQGTLAPVRSVRNLLAELDHDYSYNEAQLLLPVVTVRTAPKSKKVIAGINTTDECEANICYVFLQEFVQKAKSAILAFRRSVGEGCSDDGLGIRVPRFGIYALSDINTMDWWHDTIGLVSKTEAAIIWAVNTYVKCIGVPQELGDGVNDNPQARESKQSKFYFAEAVNHHLEPYRIPPCYHLVKTGGFRMLLWGTKLQCCNANMLM